MKPLQKLDQSFYLKDTLTASKELIGSYFVHVANGEKLIMKITETEAYMGPEDKASHAYGNRKTARTSTMFCQGGVAYVYLIYGMYYCMNVVMESEGNPKAILIRGGQPAEGMEKMSLLRYQKPFSDLNSYQRKHFADGPGKLCAAMGISKEQNGLSLLGDTFYFAKDLSQPNPIIETGPRINIDYAEEYKDKPWRFWLKETNRQP